MKAHCLVIYLVKVIMIGCMCVCVCCFYWSDLLCCPHMGQTVCYELLDMASHPSALVHCPANPPAPALSLGPVQAARTPQGPQGL